MKKYLFGIFALVLAIGFSAFTAPKQSVEKAITTYWFLTEDDGTVVNSYFFPPTSDPTVCDDSDPVRVCAKVFSSYRALGYYGFGPYAPAGMLIWQKNKTLIE